MFSCGFYNSLNGDRKYSAVQFGEMFDGLITDGVYATIGEAFAVTPGVGLQVFVGTGRAWFNKTWSVNDAKLPLNLEMADLLLPRIDAVVLEVDTRTMVRDNCLKIITGAPNVNPTNPTLTNADGIYQYPLAYVRVNANQSTVTKSNITSKIGQSPCPFVTGILQSISIDNAWIQWEGQFEEWFNNLKAQLSGDVAVNLQSQIEQLKSGKVAVSDKATVAEAKAGTNDTHWMTPSKTKSYIDQNVIPSLTSAGNTVLDSFTGQKISIGTRPRLVNSRNYGSVSDIRIGIFEAITEADMYPTYLIYSGTLVTSIRVATSKEELFVANYTYFDPRKITSSTASYWNANTSALSSNKDRGLRTLSLNGGYLAFFHMFYAYPTIYWCYLNNANNLTYDGLGSTSDFLSTAASFSNCDTMWRSKSWVGYYTSSTSSSQNSFYCAKDVRSAANTISLSSYSNPILVGMVENDLYFCRAKSSTTIEMFKVTASEAPTITAIGSAITVSKSPSGTNKRVLLSNVDTGEAIVSMGSLLAKINFKTATLIKQTSKNDDILSARYMYSVGSTAYFLTQDNLIELDKNTLEVTKYSTSDKNLCLEFGPFDYNGGTAYCNMQLPKNSISPNVDDTGNYTELLMTDPRFQRYLPVVPGWFFDSSKKLFVPDIITIDVVADSGGGSTSTTYRQIRRMARYRYNTPASYLFIGDMSSIKTLSLLDPDPSTNKYTLRNVSPTMDVIYDP